MAAVTMASLLCLRRGCSCSCACWAAWVLTDAAAETVFTSAFSGRPARGVRNTFIEAMAGKPVLPFPQQNTLTGSLRQWAASAKQPGFQSVWSGSGGDKIRPMSAAQLMATLKQELAQAAIRS